MDNLYQLKEIYNVVNDLQNLKWFKSKNRLSFEILNIKDALQLWKSQTLFLRAEERMEQLIQDTLKKNIQELLKKQPPMFQPKDNKPFFMEIIAIAQDAILMTKRELEVNFSKIDLEMTIRHSVAFFDEHLIHYCTKDNIFPTAITFFDERYKNLPPSNYLDKEARILLHKWFEDTLRKAIASTDGKRMYVEFLDLRQRIIGCTLVRGLDNQNKTTIFYKCHTLKTLFEEFTELDAQIQHEQNMSKVLKPIKCSIDANVNKALESRDRELNKLLNDFRQE